MTTHALKKPSDRLASKHRQEVITNVLCTAALVLLGLIVMFPIYWIFRSSLMSNG